MKGKAKPWIAAILGSLLVIGLLAGIKAGQIVAMVKAGESFVPPPEAVSSARVEEIRWEDTTAAIGSLVAVRAVTLRSELPGRVREILFDSGADVKQGAVLVRLDTSTEEAQLAASQADAMLARSNLERAEVLRRADSNTPAEMDASRARAKSADAMVASLRATIAKKTIRAPFDGRISIRQVELGQILSPGDPIASLQSVSPIHAEFSLPQQVLAELTVGQKVHMHTDTFPGGRWDGAITTINPEVDVATRNVRIRATFDNPDGRLRPGMFAKVDILASQPRPALAIPATAVLYAPYGDSVFVLEETKDDSGKVALVARQKFVRLGEREGDFVLVASGLAAGDVVVSSGAFKLRQGATVVVNNALAPAAEMAPKPTDK